jgi:dTDP-4-amino-4,6-dideoxygalactose transaminase
VLINEELFGIGRDRLSEALLAENIIVKKYFYPPLHEQKAFKIYHKKNMRLDSTENISRNSLDLPLFSHILPEKVKCICDAVIRIRQYRDEINCQ